MFDKLHGFSSDCIKITLFKILQRFLRYEILDISEYSMVHIIVPGHGYVLQATVSVESAISVEQSAPPLLRGGFVQLLVLDCDPVPQVTLHVSYELQADHPPSTGTGTGSVVRNDLLKSTYSVHKANTIINISTK